MKSFIQKITEAKESRFIPTKAKRASYAKSSFLDGGGSLYIWTTEESKANIQIDCDLKQARAIAKILGIDSLKVQS